MVNQLTHPYEVVAKIEISTHLPQKEMRKLLKSSLRKLGDDLVVLVNRSVKKASIHIHTKDVEEVKRVISSFSKSGTQPRFEITDLQKQVEEAQHD